MWILFPLIYIYYYVYFIVNKKKEMKKGNGCIRTNRGVKIVTSREKAKQAQLVCIGRDSLSVITPCLGGVWVGFSPSEHQESFRFTALKNNRKPQSLRLTSVIPWTGSSLCLCNLCNSFSCSLSIGNRFIRKKDRNNRIGVSILKEEQESFLKGEKEGFRIKKWRRRRVARLWTLPMLTERNFARRNWKGYFHFLNPNYPFVYLCSVVLNVFTLPLRFLVLLCRIRKKERR